jgi:hypothetical protein
MLTVNQLYWIFTFPPTTFCRWVFGLFGHTYSVLYHSFQIYVIDTKKFLCLLTMLFSSFINSSVTSPQSMCMCVMLTLKFYSLSKFQYTVHICIIVTMPKKKVQECILLLALILVLPSSSISEWEFLNWYQFFEGHSLSWNFVHNGLYFQARHLFSPF